MNRMPELVQRALSALRQFQPADRATALAILGMWAHAAEIDVERTVDYYFDGHVAHPCCGKLDNGPHLNFCRYHGDRSPSEKFLDETMMRWSIEDQERARVDLRDGRNEQLVGSPDFRDGYVEGYLDAVQAAIETLRARREGSAEPDFRAEAERIISDLEAEGVWRGVA